MKIFIHKKNVTELKGAKPKEIKLLKCKSVSLQKNSE